MSLCGRLKAQGPVISAPALVNAINVALTSDKKTGGLNNHHHLPSTSLPRTINTHIYIYIIIYQLTTKYE